MNDRIQEIRKRQEVALKIANNFIMPDSFGVQMGDLSYLLSEVERLQTKLNEAIDAMETTYSYVREEKYRLAECELEDFLSHLKG